YDCNQLKPLTTCTVNGSYAITSTSPKEQSIVLKSDGDVAANIPVWKGTTVPLAINSGESIEIKLTFIGKKRSTVAKVGKADLQGTCDGATHFIRGADVGAFMMKKQSTSGSKSSEALVKDGDLDACKSVSPDAKSLPASCQAPLRLEMVPIK